MPPICPTAITKPFNAIDIKVIAIVKTQAHPLPAKSPQATIKLAIDIPIRSPRIRPMYLLSNKKTELLGSTTSVPFTFIVILPPLLVVSLISTCSSSGAIRMNPIPPTRKRIPPIIRSIAIIVIPIGLLLSNSNCITYGRIKMFSIKCKIRIL